jgi:hypothetical protein
MHHGFQNDCFNFIGRRSRGLDRPLIDDNPVRQRIAVIPLPLRERHTLIQAEERAEFYTHVGKEVWGRIILYLDGDIFKLLLEPARKALESMVHQFFKGRPVHDFKCGMRIAECRIEKKKQENRMVSPVSCLLLPYAVKNLFATIHGCIAEFFLDADELVVLGNAVGP